MKATMLYRIASVLLIVFAPGNTYCLSRLRQLSEPMNNAGFSPWTGTVRNPDVAFVTNQHLKTIDVNRSPVDGAPKLAVGVISPNNLAQDTLKRVSQFPDLTIPPMCV